MEQEERRAVAPRASRARETMAVGFLMAFMAVNRMCFSMTQHDAGRSLEKHQDGRQTNDIHHLGLT
jgi:hypothetical protein